MKTAASSKKRTGLFMSSDPGFDKGSRNLKKHLAHKVCGSKYCYTSRKHAEFARQRMHSSGLRVFACPVTFNHYHLGRLERK